MTEIFIERCYEPDTKNIRTALDLGANIGLASIWMQLEFPKIYRGLHSYPLKNTSCLGKRPDRR